MKLLKKLLEELDKDIHDVIIVNFANCDMVGHTGVISAAIKAVSVVDECVGKVYDKVASLHGTMLITADHGNSEMLLDEDNNPYTAHTTNLVPLIVTNTHLELKENGKLGDLAPTILKLLGAPNPSGNGWRIIIKIRLLLALAIMVILSGCQKTSTITIAKNDQLPAITEVDYQSIQALKDANEPFVLLIGRPSCQDCREFDPILNAYLQENPGMYIYYFNIQEYHDKASQGEQDQKDYDVLKAELGFSWTPTMVLVNGDDIVTKYEYLSKEYYQLKDTDERNKEKEEYIQEFYSWMAKIFE